MTSGRPLENLVAPRRRSKASLAGATIAGLILAIAVPAAASAAPSDSTSTVTVPASEATWTTVRSPRTPQDKFPYLSATNSADKTYVKFDASGEAKGKSIVSASLELTVLSTAATKGGVSVYPAPNNWSAKTLTDATRPAHVATAVNTATVKAVKGKTISVPLKPSAVSTTGDTSLELRYSQPYVGTLFSTHPTLKLTLAAPAGGGQATGTVTSTPAATPPATAPATPPTTPPAANTGSTSPAPTTGPAASAPTTGKAFATAAPNSSAKKVFAHYFPPYPISLDNKPAASDYYAQGYLNPQGEHGIHASYGGLLRDRPEPRAPLSGDWWTADLETEVNQAADAGIDGFTVDIMSLSGRNWDQTVRLMDAAVKSGRNFTITPNVDVSAAAGNASPAELAGKLAQLYHYSSAYRLSDGRYVLSSFLAERNSTAWWSQVMSILQNTYGIKTAFIAVLLNANDQNMKAFAPISYALSNWGERTPKTIQNEPDYAAKAHALGVKWMQPVAVQDARPRNRLYAEAGNTETLRASWSRAISDSADLVQLTTWNDYSESTSFAPSAEHGESFLDIDAYYLSQFKSGTAPKITGDAMFVTHRKQFVSARPTAGRSPMSPTLDGTSMAPRDTVEVLTFLTAPATVQAVIGGKTYTANAPAGVSAVTFPLGLGSVSATATRNGSDILSVTSPYKVTSNPATLDLEYVAANSHGN